MMFWSYLFCFLSLLALFWTDLIPGFGDASTIKMFWEKLGIFLFILINFIENISKYGPEWEFLSKMKIFLLINSGWISIETN